MRETIAVAERHELHELLRDALDDLCRLGATGAQGQVHDAGRDVSARAWANYDGTSFMPAAGRFRIGCATATFTSVVVLRLAAEGRLSLDDAVASHLPGLGLDAATTVRDLLRHTSGRPDYLGALAGGPRFAHRDPEELVALSRGPRTEGWSYSNTNYVLAGLVVRAVTGRSWAEQVRNHIARPLGLRDTYYPYDHPSLPRSSARAYQQQWPGGPLVDVTELNPTALDAAGGLVSSTADLTRFWCALRRGELLGPDWLAELDRVVPAQTYQQVLPGLGFGLGVFRVPSRSGGFWAHPGAAPGTASCNGVNDDGSRCVVLYRTTTPADPGLRAAMDARALRLVQDVLDRPAALG
ncbi:serine hydrolase domain-containing protein [Dactylosporangium sp. CA-139114]|uniref:serine hydrolase domain-containing protein n=1 Tax=Dactylosporangium sp. CA-139114 TaxID=3239931 RepID=UPI003D98F482